MRFSIFKVLSTFIVLGFSTNSYSLGNSGWTTVTEIFQGQGNSPIVKLSDMGDSAKNCNNTEYLRFRNADSEVGKRHFSTLLAALSSGNEVNIKTIACSSDHAYIEEIQIRH